MSVVTCALEANVPHVHTDACFYCTPVLQCAEQITEEEPIAILSCQEYERMRHIHDVSCFDESGALVCGKLELREHIHEDACFVETVESTEELALACDYEEHEHTEECVPKEECTDATLPGEETPIVGLYCGYVEHVHQDGCFNEEGTLLCTMSEHEHSWICELIPSDFTAVETADDWEADLPELNGRIADDLTAVAKSQLGYAENEANYIIEDGELFFYSRYSAWWNEEYPYTPWNAKFVSFCLNYADIDFELYEDAASWFDDLQWNEQLLPEDYRPIAADLVFFDTDADDEADCVGIITYVDPENNHMTVIHERNGKVRERDYTLDDADILSYARIPGNAPATVEVMDISSERVDHVIHLIDIMPSAEEFDETLSLYEANDDWDGYESYYKQVYRQALNAYVMYEDLSEPLREQVSNADKLLELQWLWSAQTLGITQGIDVYQINDYPDGLTTADASATVLLKGGSPDDYGIVNMTFAYWSAIVVEADNNGLLYVSNVDTTGNVDKSAYGPETENGFVLFVWDGNLSFAQVSASVHKGDIVSVPFDYSQPAAYNGSSYGTVTFASGNFKVDKDNTSKLEIVQGADTNDLIEVNLYDYGVNINGPYNTDNRYPGFQQDNGTTLAALSKYGMNFGNNITTDLDAGISELTNKGGAINATASSYNGVEYGVANIPLEGTMSRTLLNGYPALADGTPLQYLFHGNSGYATKKNSSSINGLFQHNELSGAYAFNSRENHAQFNADSDTFTLYKQIISSNFIMYPFGNFLPFNDIVHLSAQTSTIDRAYLQSIASSALYKYNAGYGEEYQTLATELTAFIDLMDAKYGTDWAAADAMNEYFSAAGLPPTFSQSDPLLDKVYSIDFDEPTDFYFGMEMKMNFMMPKNGLTGKDNGDNASDTWLVNSDGTYYRDGSPDGIPDYPMVFNFTGDDDVWVYIDGVLFLDLSGIHRHVGGRINFENGTVEYFVLDPATGDVAATPYKTVRFADILGSSDNLNAKGTFKDYTQHTFNFYYMERGAGSGVCRMNFNFPLLKQNTINISKAVESTADIQGDPDYKFQVLKANADDTKTDELFIGASVGYTIYDLNNEKIGASTTDINGVFTLKAGQRAEFEGIKENSGKYYVRELLEGSVLEQYGKITVSGESTTTSNNVTIGNDTFTGADSPVKDISDGTTAFLFTNHVEETKLGDLSISKILTTYPKTRESKVYNIEVTLDGKPLPVGTEYTVATKDTAVTETREVITAGIVTIAANETAKISNILAGTQFTVQETSDSAAGYIVTYTSADGYPIEKDGKATGTIITDANVQLVVTNSEKGASVTFPITKTVLNPDGARDYKFRIVQVHDSSGAAEVDGSESEITVNAQDYGETSYTLNFIQTTGSFYYKITEVNEKTVFRENVQTYVIQVTVVEDAEAQNGAKATITGVWKDGTPISYIEGESFSADFTNTLVGSLTLSKEVVGTTPESGFSFKIQLENGGTPVSETFPAGADKTVIFTDGVAIVTLAAGESITISDIPYGTTWTIIETNADGYVVTYTVNGEDGNGTESAGSIIVGSTEVAYTNSAMYELPETGGGGAMGYRLMGSGMLLTLPILYAIKGRYRGRRVKGG